MLMHQGFVEAYHSNLVLQKDIVGLHEAARKSKSTHDRALFEHKKVQTSLASATTHNTSMMTLITESKENYEKVCKSNVELGHSLADLVEKFALIESGEQLCTAGVKVRSPLSTHMHTCMTHSPPTHAPTRTDMQTYSTYV